MPVRDVDALLAHLGSLDEDGLAAVMRHRPDAVALPWPAHIVELAERLHSRESIAAAYVRLPLPHIEVLGALSFLEWRELPATTANLAWWLDGDPRVVEAVLDDLRSRALIWTTADGEIAIPTDFFTEGAYLGPPVRAVLEQSTLATLRPMASALGLAHDGPKKALVDRLLAYFRDGDAVRALVDSGPEDEHDLLLGCAEQGTPLEYFEIFFGSYSTKYRERAGDWSVARGLLWPESSGLAHMPLEVTLALRGEGWRLPFHPEPPPVGLHSVPAEHIDAEAAAHLLRMIEHISVLLDSTEVKPLPLLKSGSVGVRTVRTLAKEWSAEVDEATLAVELAVAAGLLEPAAPPEPPRGRGRRPQPRLPSPGLIPGKAAAAWQASDAGARGAMILTTWWSSDVSVLMDAQSAADLGVTAVYKNLRQDLLGVYAEFPWGQGVSAASELIPLMAWRTPVADEDILVQVFGAAVREAELLGVLALGTASSSGRSLIEGGLETATSDLVAGAHTSAVIGADLTAVVFGPPTTELSRFLDSVATRESRGAGTTWRFTADSVRAAFDRGAAAAELIGELESIAQSGVPQVVEYLINDVARTHGSLGVMELGCVVLSEDPALLLELVGNRKLAKLGLSTLAPTVVASRSDPDATVSALRAAGYAPVLRGTDGSVVLSAVPVSQSAPAVDEAGEVRAHVTAIEVPDMDPQRHARHLLATVSQQPTESAHSYGFLVALRGRGDQEAIWRLADGRPARVTYKRRTHLVHSARLHGNTLTVWSATTDRYEDFPVAQISVSSAQGSEGGSPARSER